MKATITAEGALVLTPESSLESYALAAWVEDKSAVVNVRAWVECPAPFEAGTKVKTFEAQEQAK